MNRTTVILHEGQNRQQRRAIEAYWRHVRIQRRRFSISNRWFVAYLSIWLLLVL